MGKQQWETEKSRKTPSHIVKIVLCKLKSHVSLVYSTNPIKNGNYCLPIIL